MYKDNKNTFLSSLFSELLDDKDIKVLQSIQRSRIREDKAYFNKMRKNA